MPETPARRSGRPVFRPRFTLMILYLAFFTALFALLLALPDLISAFRELPPGGATASPEDLERASEATRRALAGGRLYFALGAAVVCVGLAAWSRALPGLR